MDRRGPRDLGVTVRGDGVDTEFAAPSGEPSFTRAIRRIHRVVRGLEAPRHLAVDEALGNARAIAALLAAARGR